MHGPEADELDAGGAADASAAGLFADINITPLTDVILVLLIIAMVSSSAMVDAAHHQDLPIALPSAQDAPTAARPDEVLVIGMTADGHTLIGEQITSDAALEAHLSQLHARAPATPVIIEADGHVPHRHVVALLDRVRAAGFTTVGIGAQAQPAG